MCVIAFVQKDEQRLTEDQINKMWAANSFGVGISYRDEVDGQKVIRWMKGLNLAQTQEEVPKLPLPHIIHFRNPSNGTSHAINACHPFPLEGDVPMDLDGTSPNGVLFHNGFWTGWKDKLIDWSLRGGFILPSGGWSDSRGLAWAAANLGNGILDLIDEKVIIMTPTDIESFGSGWTEMANGLFVSNLQWQNPPKTQHHGSHYTTPPASMAGGTTAAASGTDGKDDKKGKSGGASQQGSFCGTRWLRDNQHGRVPGFTGNSALPLRSDVAGSAQQDQVQAAGEGVVSPELTAASEQLDWALSVARGTICEDCRQVPGNVIALGVRRCFACWEKAQQSAATREHGTCEFCSKVPTTYLTTAEAKWICHACWRQHGKPEIVRDEDLRPNQQQAIQARRAGGTI
jgi:hypothetical protein